jgi:hypoxanthine-DNA glycosylase
MALVYSFPPLFSPNAKVLVLGSMPGVASLQAQQYYAHPRNAFWPLMSALFQVPVYAAYEQRCAASLAAGVALWDVLAECTREGSLDARIEASSIVVNDVVGLLQEAPGIQCVGCNGATAARLFQRHIAPRLRVSMSERCAQLRVLHLPSTSPAHAALSFDQKLQAWRALVPPSS